MTVKLDRERRLRYDFAAWKRLEEITGFSILRGGLKLQRLESISFFSAMLFVGLVHEDPTLTQDQVEAMLDPAVDPPRLIDPIWDAVTEVFPPLDPPKATDQTSQ